jgi:hypothetical protein
VTVTLAAVGVAFAGAPLPSHATCLVWMQAPALGA